MGRPASGNASARLSGRNHSSSCRQLLWPKQFAHEGRPGNLPAYFSVVSPRRRGGAQAVLDFVVARHRPPRLVNPAFSLRPARTAEITVYRQPEVCAARLARIMAHIQTPTAILSPPVSLIAPSHPRDFALPHARQCSHQCPGVCDGGATLHSVVICTIRHQC